MHPVVLAEKGNGRALGLQSASFGHFGLPCFTRAQHLAGRSLNHGTSRLVFQGKFDAKQAQMRAQAPDLEFDALLRVALVYIPAVSAVGLNHFDSINLGCLC